MQNRGASGGGTANFLELFLTGNWRGASIGVRLQAFQLAWEYLLFDNRMIHARTRLVLVCCLGCTEAIGY